MRQCVAILLLTFFLLCLALIAGFTAGHYHGKAKVYERFFEKQITVALNPVTLEKMQ